VKFLSSQRFLAIYSGILTLVFAFAAVGGFATLRNPQFGTITARRINIVEPDGTVRLTISNRADFPGGWVRGKEYAFPERRDAAGMLFMSEEGTEQGGFIWGAHQEPDGSVQNHLHLSFDQYEENQIFAVDAGREGNDKFSRITIVDQGDYPTSEKREAFQRIMRLPQDQQDREWNKFFSAHPAYDTKRLVLGRAEDGSVGVDLKDANGKSRIVLMVRPDGKPQLKFLDANGKVTNEWTAEKK
jgi:hypothetical protein